MIFFASSIVLKTAYSNKAELSRDCVILNAIQTECRLGIGFDLKSNELIFHEQKSINRVPIENSINVDHEIQIEVGKSNETSFFFILSMSN